MNQTLTSLFKLYLDRSALAESSVEIKTRALRYWNESLGDMPVADVRYSHAEDFKVVLAKGRSQSAANTYLANFKPFFSWLFKSGYIESDPFTQISLYSVGQTIMATYNRDEIERLMLVADHRWKAIILLAMCSLRRAEILNLNVSDIHFDEGYIHITPKKDTVTTWKWAIKDYNQAITPLPTFFELPNMKLDLHLLLVELIENLPPKQPYLILKPETYQRRMQQKAEGKLNYDKRVNPWGNFNRYFKRLLKRACVEHKRFHDLRGTFATNMIKAGRSLKETQMLMRHSSASTTARYYIQVDQRELVSKTNETLKKYYVSAVA